MPHDGRLGLLRADVAAAREELEPRAQVAEVGLVHEEQRRARKQQLAITATLAVVLGSADDIVYYEVTLSQPRLFPMARLLGWSATQSVTVSTMVRNQPWANQTTPTIRCS